MRLSSATVTLAGVALTGDVGITGLSVNGQAIVGVTSGVRATAVAVTSRGNASMSISFTALREFASEALLEQFVIAHFGALTKGGALVFTVDGVSKTASSAAVQSVAFGEPIGLILPVTYFIICSPLL